MATSIYVGNLSWSATQEGVESLFSSFGNVHSVNLISDRETGRARGFGFVEMESAEDAQNAAKALNGFLYEGRNLIVNEARPEQKTNFTRRDDRAGGGGGNRSFGNDRPPFRSRRDRG